MATEALRVLDVPKDLPDATPEPQEAAPAETDDLAIADLGLVRAERHGRASRTANSRRHWTRAAAEESGPKVPNFRGKTMRAVVEEASAMGLPVLLDGSGIARAQFPPPGSVLPAGERVRVEFAR